MGTVHFTQGHHGLVCRHDNPDVGSRILLTPDMMDIPIISSLKTCEPVRESRASMTWAAIRGLQMLGGFNAAISMTYKSVPEVGSYLLTPHRMWGEISMGTPENLVVTFSHDSRYANDPFVSLYQWLEGKCPALTVSDAEFYAFEREWSDPMKWHEFFKNRIQRKVSYLRGLAAESERKSNDLVADAAVIEAALA